MTDANENIESSSERDAEAQKNVEVSANNVDESESGENSVSKTQEVEKSVSVTNLHASHDFTNDDTNENENNFYTTEKSQQQQPQEESADADQGSVEEYKPGEEEQTRESRSPHISENADNTQDYSNYNNNDENGDQTSTQESGQDQEERHQHFQSHNNNNNNHNNYNNNNNNNYNFNNGSNSDFEPEVLRKVFVGSLNYNTSEETFRNHFSKYGELVDSVIMKEPKSNKSRGFGFVTYTRSTMVDEMMRNRPHKLDGRELDTKRATPREESGKPGAEATTEKLFVGAIKEGLTEDQMREYFSQYGNIQDCVIIRDKETQKSRGFGFVTFDDYDPVDKIVLEKFHTIQNQSVAVKKALPKDQNNQNNNGGNMNNFGGGGYMNNNNCNRNFNNNNFGGGGNSMPFQMQPNNNFQPNRFNDNDFNNGNFNSFANGGSCNGGMPGGNFGGNNNMPGRRTNNFNNNMGGRKPNMGGMGMNNGNGGGPMRNYNNNGPRRNNGPYSGGPPNRMQQRQNQ